SEAITIRIASRPLLMNGCSRSSSRVAGYPAKPGRLTEPGGLILDTAADELDGISVLHQNGHDRDRHQKDHHADKNYRGPAILRATIAPPGDRRAYGPILLHVRSSASTSNTTGR